MKEKEGQMGREEGRVRERKEERIGGEEGETERGLGKKKCKIDGARYRTKKGTCILRNAPK